MEAVLINLLALLRPIFFIDSGPKLFGLKVVEVAAISLSAMVLLALSITMTVRKSMRLSAIDVFLLAFVFWCIVAYVTYPEKALLKEVMKLALPPLTYVITKNVVIDRVGYQRMLEFMIVGFAVPVLLSGALIIVGQGVDYISYWTKIPRYRGVYSGAHNMAHNMAFLLMTMLVYQTVLKERFGKFRVGPLWTLFCVGLASVALYCLYSGRVRTTILGLLAFVVVYLFYVNRRWLFVSALVLGVTVPIAMPSVVVDLFYDVAKVTSGEWEFGKLGSNRLNIWQQNVAKFGDLTLDRQIAGVGIGNKLDIVSELSEDFDVDDIRNSHNDYLEILVQTGVVGFFLFATAQVLLFNRIRRLRGRDRHVFLAFFGAVFVMNFVSNSYVTRFGLAQMFFMVMAFVEIPERLAVEESDVGQSGKEKLLVQRMSLK